MAVKRKRAVINEKKILSEIANIAFTSYSDFVKIVDYMDEEGEIRQKTVLLSSDKIPKSKSSAISSIKETSSGIEIKLYDKWRALETLAKAYKLFELDEEENNDTEGVKIIDDITR